MPHSWDLLAVGPLAVDPLAGDWASTAHVEASRKIARIRGCIGDMLNHDPD
jgi:hypothetical protein